VSLALIAAQLRGRIFGARLVADLVQSEGIWEPFLRSRAAICHERDRVRAWYWEFDRGGPLERAAGTSPFPTSCSADDEP
jgi:hypothetical protein